MMIAIVIEAWDHLGERHLKLPHYYSHPPETKNNIGVVDLGVTLFPLKKILRLM